MIFPADSGFGRLQGCCSALGGVLKLWAFLSGLVSRLRRERAGQQPETVESITRRPPPTARPAARLDASRHADRRRLRGRHGVHLYGAITRWAHRLFIPPRQHGPTGATSSSLTTWAISPEITTRAIRAVIAKRFASCVGGALKALPQNWH